MIKFLYKYIASIVLLITVLIGSINVEILGKQISYYINLQLILIYLFKISNYYLVKDETAHTGFSFIALKMLGVVTFVKIFMKCAIIIITSEHRKCFTNFF